MKKYLLLCLMALIVISCDDVQDNTPAFQGNLDNVFYRALDSKATAGEDGTVAIVGTTSDQNVTIILSVLQSGSFQLNSGNGHQAYYEDPTGQIYSTENGGSGEVNITGRGTDAGNEFISGNFTFTAILEGIDTITFSRGLLYQVPVVSGVIEDPDDPIEDGTFMAEIDGELFDPSTVETNIIDTFIVISGALGDDTIQLIIPRDAEPITQAIPGDGFNAIYFISGEEERAVSGSIEVVTHDMAAQNISGTFSFVTENHVISLGEFNIDY